MRVTVHHRGVPADLGLGVVVAAGLEAGPAPKSLAEAIDARVAARTASALTPAEDALRQSCRDLLRNGAYKPTGRGKPASEYLLRAALEGQFPRVSGPVDANNLVSLAHLVPISLWDLELAATDTFEVRLGGAEERYVFNGAGQTLELRDLLCGCGLRGGAFVPMVTPVKDSLATKLVPTTTRVAGCIYFPLQHGGRERLLTLAEELSSWLCACGGGVRAKSAACLPNESVTLEVEDG